MGLWNNIHLRKPGGSMSCPLRSVSTGQQEGGKERIGGRSEWREEKEREVGRKGGREEGNEGKKEGTREGG